MADSLYERGRAEFISRACHDLKILIGVAQDQRAYAGSLRPKWDPVCMGLPHEYAEVERVVEKMRGRNNALQRPHQRVETPSIDSTGEPGETRTQAAS